MKHTSKTKALGVYMCEEFLISFSNNTQVKYGQEWNRIVLNNTAPCWHCLLFSDWKPLLSLTDRLCALLSVCMYFWHWASACHTMSDERKRLKTMLQSFCQAIQTVWPCMTRTNSLSFRLIDAGVGSAARCSGLVLCLVLLFACLFFCLSVCLTSVTQGEDF